MVKLKKNSLYAVEILPKKLSQLLKLMTTSIVDLINNIF